FFAASSTEPFQFKPSVKDALETFPKEVFVTATGRIGGQELLWSAMLFWIAVSMIGMRREAWQYAKGGLAIAGMLAFLVYLFIPEDGLGGAGAKARIAWGVFLLGGLFASSVHSSIVLRMPVAFYVFAFLLPNLIATADTLRTTSRVVEDYLAAADRIP